MDTPSALLAHLDAVDLFEALFGLQGPLRWSLAPLRPIDQDTHGDPTRAA